MTGIANIDGKGHQTIMAFFKKSGDQLAKEAIADYKKGNDEISVIKRLEQALQLGLKIYPLDEIYKYIGAAYDELSLPDKAQQAYEKALTFNPKNHTVLSNLGLIYETRGNSMKALEYYKASLESNPENSFALHNIGVMLYREGNFIEALGYFKRTIKLNPHLSTSHAMMSRCYAYIGQFEKAQASFIQAGKCGYDNIKNLRSELREIKKELPRVLFDHDKFVAFCYMVCPNCDEPDAKDQSLPGVPRLNSSSISTNGRKMSSSPLLPFITPFIGTCWSGI